MEVHAAQDETISIYGLQDTEEVYIYRFADYADEKFVWTKEVSDCLTNEESIYSSLTPDHFLELTDYRAKEICEKLISRLTKISGEEAATEEAGTEETVTEETTGNENLFPALKKEGEEVVFECSVPYGYYIILPLSKERIYQLKWIAVNDSKQESGDTYQVIYLLDEENADYSFPTVTVSAAMETLSSTGEVEDRGNGSGEDEDGMFVNYEDVIRIDSKVTFPSYSSLYVKGKRIENIYMLLPYGVDYKDDSLSLMVGSNTLKGSEYGQQTIRQACVYFTPEGEALFFQTENGWYYQMDGSSLAFEETPENVWELFKQCHGLKESELTVDDLEPMQFDRIFIFSLDASLNWKELTITYEVKKNEISNDTGRYLLRTGFVYSMNPLDYNQIGNMYEEAKLLSYGVRITVCNGKGYNQYSDPLEILQDAQRLQGAVFSIYQFHGKTYEGDLTSERENEIQTDTTAASAIQKETESTEGTESSEETEIVQEKALPVMYLYDEQNNMTKEYSLYQSLAADENGVIVLGGLPKGDYIIVESTFPTGYTYSKEKMVIMEDNWSDAEYMEGNYLLDTLWLDYPTVYLPGTGKHGTFLYTLTGTLISGLALLLIRIKIKRKKIYIQIVH